ncbi:MAG: hypothetical protein PHF74_02875 [Dehalococcoidales bacterium]|nr:hypothetical protein [Dehalococcoidales bacterium]
MDIEQRRELLATLPPNEKKVIYTSVDGTEISVTRTDELTVKDFSVFLKKPGEEEFTATFIRLLIDLHIKKISKPDEIDALSKGFESIYKGEDCSALIEGIDGKTFPMQLDKLDINMVCAQLLMIKQEFNYGHGKRETVYDPARGYQMAYIRWVLSKKNEIDKIVEAVVKEYIPPEKFDN